MKKTAAGILLCFGSLLFAHACAVHEEVGAPVLDKAVLASDTPCTMQMLWGPVSSNYAGGSTISADQASQQCNGFYNSDKAQKNADCSADCNLANGTNPTISPVLNPDPNDPTGMTGGPAFSFCQGFQNPPGGEDSQTYSATGRANFFCYCCI
jgi:hypothetical protein